MKTYQGARGPNGRASVAIHEPSSAARALDARRDLRNHSPDNLDWGYAGSGPSQLALALLADPFSAGPGGARLAAALYQDFKFAVVAGLPREGWTLTGEAIGQALCRLAAEHPAHFWGRVVGALDAGLFEAAVAAMGEDPSPAQLQSAAEEIITRALPVSADYARRQVADYYQREGQQP